MSAMRASSSTFLIAYALSYLGAGWVTDKLGAKLTLALFLGWWSLANMATGWVRNAAQLGFARMMLGIGEPGVYTAGPKAVAEHFPPAERGFAIGVYTAGAMIGATIAPPLIAWLALQYGWRAAFVITGAAGFVWLAIWLVRVSQPRGRRTGANEGADPLGSDPARPQRLGPGDHTPDRGSGLVLLSLLVPEISDRRARHGADPGREPRLDRLSRGRYRQRRRRLFLRSADSLRHRSGSAAD